MKKRYPDLHEHLKALDEAGLLITVERPINKDTELHPLVRWQFRGGIEERDRKAFLFTNVVDSKNRKYDIPVVVGALAASREIYRIGMGCALERINETWSRAIANPIAPNVVKEAPCHDMVFTQKQLEQGKGLDSLPIPISTPGWDIAPFTTLSQYITRDPDSGVQNMVTPESQLSVDEVVNVAVAPATLVASTTMFDGQRNVGGTVSTTRIVWVHME